MNDFIKDKLQQILHNQGQGFKNQLGKYEDPDFTLMEPWNPNPAPQELINSNCKTDHIIYSSASKALLKPCTFIDQMAVLMAAYQQAIDYFEEAFQCKNESCIKKQGEIIWTAYDCWKDEVNPAFGEVAIAAIEVRFFCVEEY